MAFLATAGGAGSVQRSGATLIITGRIPPAPHATLHSWVFWNLTGGTALRLIAKTGATVHIIPIMGSKGVSEQTALVPLPRVQLVRYVGCLAPHSQLCGAIIPTPRQQGVANPANTCWLFRAFGDAFFVIYGGKVLR